MYQPKGIIVPIITPFTEDGSIDFEGYRKLISRLIERGIHGIFPLGTTGEFYAVSDGQYRELLEVTVAEVAGRVQVVAGANHITTRGVVRLVEICNQIAGIDAISVLTPMFVSPTQDALYQHYESIAESTDLPVIMYNNSPMTHVHIEPQTVARLAQIPNIISIKDSTGDFKNTSEYIRLTRGNENFCVLIGRDHLIYAGLCHGAAGAIASCANIAPRLIADIYDKFIAGDRDAALEAQLALNPLSIACGMGIFPTAIKEGLNLQSFPAGKCIEPVAELSAEQKLKLKDVLVSLNLIDN